MKASFNLLLDCFT